ncbi:unnamed protein product [Sphacelaria rigidula]
MLHTGEPAVLRGFVGSRPEEGADCRWCGTGLTLRASCLLRLGAWTSRWQFLCSRFVARSRACSALARHLDGFAMRVAITGSQNLGLCKRCGCMSCHRVEGSRMTITASRIWNVHDEVRVCLRRVIGHRRCSCVDWVRYFAGVLYTRQQKNLASISISWRFFCLFVPVFPKRTEMKSGDDAKRPRCRQVTLEVTCLEGCRSSSDVAVIRLIHDSGFE